MSKNAHHGAHSRPSRDNRLFETGRVRNPTRDDEWSWPDRCIDALSAEAHGTVSVDAVVDKLKAAVKLTTDRPHSLRQAIYCCRKTGTLSVAGVYVGFPDKFPVGAFMNKGLTRKTGQIHMHRYMRPLLERIEAYMACVLPGRAS